ncbi:26592_t:CDS:1, partial [Dentiscutata erythropus]
IPKVILPRVPQVFNQQPVIPYVQYQRPTIPRPLQQIQFDNQLQQQLNNQFGITPRPVVPYNTAPPRIPKKPKHLQFLKRNK